jgi:hypothetical protein
MLHIWLCTCRQLMFASPLEGVYLDHITFKGQSGLKAGWNKEDLGPDWPTGFLFLDPGEHAHRVENLPEDVDESAINIVRPVQHTDARKSELWAAAQAVVPYLENLGPLPEGLSAQKVIMSIESFADMKRSTLAMAPHAARIAREAFAKPLDFGSRNGPDVALQMAERYMRFELPGTIARYGLGAIYKACYSQVPQLFKRKVPPLKVMLQKKIEELADITYQLLSEREQYNVTGFFNASYLACLCGGTVIAMCTTEGDALKKAGFSPEEETRLLRLKQNVDEMLAHHLAATFCLPARMIAADILQWIRLHAQMVAWPPAKLAKQHSLHPGLTAILELPNSEAMSREQVLGLYMENSLKHPGLGIKATLEKAADALKVKLYNWLQPT